jgi:hypothetical protein
MKANVDNVKATFGSTCRKMGLFAMLMTALLSALPLHSSADVALSLAHFAAGERALEGRVAFPDVEGDLTLLLQCRTFVSKRGIANNTFCLEHDRELESLLATLHDAVNKSRMIPAMVDGKAEEVRILFRVLFVRRGNNASVHVYENWGHDVETLGFDYRAPQVRSRKGTSYKCFRHDRPLVAQATIRISETGRPSGQASVEFAEGSAEDAGCEQQLKEELAASAFIPAEANGKPVEATFTTVIGWVTSSQAN